MFKSYLLFIIEKQNSSTVRLILKENKDVFSNIFMKKSNLHIVDKCTENAWKFSNTVHRVLEHLQIIAIFFSKGQIVTDRLLNVDTSVGLRRI